MLALTIRTENAETENAERKQAMAERKQAMKDFKPLLNRVLIKRVEALEETPGGILIPDTAKEKPAEGEVLAVGPGKRDEKGRHIPLDVQVGDRIVFAKWSGTDILINGEDRVIIKEVDILGVIGANTQVAEKAA
jgi:chaperonin GroES